MGLPGAALPQAALPPQAHGPGVAYGAPNPAGYADGGAFGLPQPHEDDALRAVRAATGMQAELHRVNKDLSARYGVVLANRTGVNTGEVVATDDPAANQKLATGDAVNVAARLEQAAPVGEIYLGG